MTRIVRLLADTTWCDWYDAAGLTLFLAAAFVGCWTF